MVKNSLIAVGTSGKLCGSEWCFKYSSSATSLIELLAFSFVVVDNLNTLQKEIKCPGRSGTGRLDTGLPTTWQMQIDDHL
jgi:hypothetical protein